MALVSLQGACFDYGREKILNNVDLALHPGVKCALVGPNGAGKTTLLAALSGELTLQDGSRQAMGQVSIRLLRQETSLDPEGNDGGRLLDTVAASAFARELKLEQDLALLSHQLEGCSEAESAVMIEQQGRLQAEFERLGGYTVRARLETALRGVGLLPESWDRTVVQLSGGERRRAALATVLLSGADLLLLDEPTNHLDLESCEWLEGFLGQYPGAAIIVSHDRYFLDRVTTRTLHLDRARVVSYSGNYSFFYQQSALRYEQDLNAWQRQQVRIRQTEDYIRRNIEGQKTKQAQARRKQMAKKVKLERPTTEPGLFRFKLEPVRASGGTVLQVEQLAKRYDDRILVADFDLHVSRGDRIGIIGPNGCGKSTLLKIMAARVVADQGRVVLGHNVDLGFYDQELSSVSDHNTVMSEIASVDPKATLGELRSFLAAFGFGEDLYDRQVARLSGGERGRLALMRLIKEGHNALLLDEPTNHLDIRSRESLEAALADYAGTLLVVSHDRRFLDKIVDKLLVFPGVNETSDGQVRIFDGNYADWARRRESERLAKVERKREADKQTAGKQTAGRRARPQPQNTSDQASTTKTPLSKNEQNRRRQLIAEAEEAIMSLEDEKDTVLAEMAKADLRNDRRIELGRRCSEIETLLAEKMADWEKWNLEIEEGI